MQTNARASEYFDSKVLESMTFRKSYLTKVLVKLANIVCFCFCVECEAWQTHRDPVSAPVDGIVVAHGLTL